MLAFPTIQLYQIKLTYELTNICGLHILFNICIFSIDNVITALKFIINLYIVSTLLFGAWCLGVLVSWWHGDTMNYQQKQLCFMSYFFVFDAVKNIHFTTTKKRNCKISLIYIFNFASYALSFTSTLPNWIIKCAFNTSWCCANYFYFFRCFNFTQKQQQRQ